MTVVKPTEAELKQAQAGFRAGLAKGKKDLVALGKIKPTEAELKQARAMLDKCTPKEKKSKMACMSSWAKKQEDVTAANSRGDDRTRYLESYLVHQLRLKLGVKTVESSREAVEDKSDHLDMVWMSVEKMNTELGTAKAEHWRESGLLNDRNDVVTGSDKPEFKEYHVPVDWSRMTSSDLRKLKIRTVNDEADEKDLELVTEAALSIQGVAVSAPQASSSDGPQANTVTGFEVKLEPVDLEEEAKKAMEVKVKNLQSNSMNLFQTQQSRSLECKLLLQTANTNGNPYTQAFTQDLSQHIVKLDKVVRILERLVTEKVMDAGTNGGLPALVKTLESLEIAHTSLFSWASRFGFHMEKKPKKRKKNEE